MLKRILLGLAVVWGCLGAFADNIRVVSASYRYVVPENCSQAEAKAVATERAITEALAREYGTTIQAETRTDIRNSDNGSQTDFWKLGSSIVRGQWLETIGEPEFRFLTDGGNVVLEVKLKGRVAPLSTRTIDLKAVPLRVSREGVFESSRFKNGERLELKFSSPVDGSLLVFLADEEGTVSQLLPFLGQREGAFTIAQNMEYVLFRDNRAEGTEQYSLSTELDMERNILYVLFSPNHLVKPITSSAAGLRYLSEKDFRRWLSERRTTDLDLQLRVIPLTITR